MSNMRTVTDLAMLFKGLHESGHGKRVVKVDDGYNVDDIESIEYSEVYDCYVIR